MLPAAACLGHGDVLAAARDDWAAVLARSRLQEKRTGVEERQADDCQLEESLFSRPQDDNTMLGPAAGCCSSAGECFAGMRPSGGLAMARRRTDTRVESAADTDPHP